MQAIRVHHFGDVDSLVTEDVPRPAPGEGEVLLRVKAAGVGPWDAWIRSGRSVLPQSLPWTLGADRVIDVKKSRFEEVLCGLPASIFVGDSRRGKR